MGAETSGSESLPAAQSEVVVVGTPRTEISDAADRLLDGITVALQEFDTETLEAIADYRDEVEGHDPHYQGWMGKLIRQYVEVWR